MARILIAYATKEGHTATIAERLQATLVARGHDVQVERMSKQPFRVPPETDAVVVGGSVHTGKHLAELAAFAKQNRDRLTTLPSALVTICLTAVEDTPEAVAETEKYVQQFMTETGWRPAHTVAFAGRLAWTQYDFFTRLIMKLITRKQGMTDQDTSRDYDYTDYEAVQRFAEDFALEVEQQQVA
jgi:menaquinone-dependent protoporphyrinogen oxidase